MKSAHSTKSEENQAASGAVRSWWQYGLETVWAAGAGVLAARPFPWDNESKGPFRGPFF